MLEIIKRIMLYKDLQNFIDTETDFFVKGMVKQGGTAFRNALPILNQMETRNGKPDGFLSYNEYNVEQINKFQDSLFKSITKASLESLIRRYTNAFPRVSESTIDYYTSKFGQVHPIAIQKIESLTSTNIKASNDRMGTPALIENIFRPAVDSMASYLVDESRLTTLIRDMEKRVADRFDNYLRPIADRLLQNHFRSTSLVIGDSFSLVWVTYNKTGSSKSDSRRFCKFHESGKRGNPTYYHIDEVKNNWIQFNGGDWDGMIKGTNSDNVLENGGGWGCVHSFRYELAGRVSQKDKARALRLGYI
jgi:hypothetical protein